MMLDRPVPDIEALDTLFKRFYKPLRAYAYRFVDDKDLSEDIVQDTFFELWAHRETIRFTDNSISSYLFKAVYNRSLGVLNKEKQHAVCSLEANCEYDILDQYLSSYIQNSEQSLLLKELEDEIMAYINALPPQCHKIFMLSRSYCLKNREIADQLNISIKAVEKQISKALYGLKEHLRQKDLFPFLVLAVTLLSAPQ